MEEKSFLENIGVGEVEIPHIYRIFASIIDWVIEIIGIIAFYFLVPRDFVSQLSETIPYLKYIVAFLIIFGYRLICILSFDKTIGMKIFRIKYLNDNFLPLTPKEKLIAAFAARTKKIRYYKL